MESIAIHLSRDSIVFMYLQIIFDLYYFVKNCALPSAFTSIDKNLYKIFFTRVMSRKVGNHAALILARMQTSVPN